MTTATPTTSTSTSAITEVAIALRSQKPVNAKSDTVTRASATSETIALTLVNLVLGNPIPRGS